MSEKPVDSAAVEDGATGPVFGPLEDAGLTLRRERHQWLPGRRCLLAPRRLVFVEDARKIVANGQGES